MTKTNKCVLEVEINGNFHKIQYLNELEAKKAINNWKQLSGDKRNVRFV